MDENRVNGWIPRRYETFVFGLLLSGFMSCMVTCVATMKSLGLIDGFVGYWMAAWVSAWPVAFASVLVVAPLTRRLVHRICKDT